MDKKEKVFYFSVEGQTEKEYLKWLEHRLNERVSPDRKVKFDIQVGVDPMKRTKTLPKDENIEVFHFCDYESTDPSHQRAFERTIDDLVKAKKSLSIKNYYLAYSNYTFELWLILHKNDFYSASSHRKNYIRQLNHFFGTDCRGMQEFKRRENLRKVFAQLTLEDVQTAIAREKEIQQHNQLNGYQNINYKGYTYYRENPSLSVGECIEKILKECELI